MDSIAAMIMTGIVILVVCAIFAWPTMMLWNICLVPAVGVSAIGFWQALGLMLLSRLLFK